MTDDGLDSGTNWITQIQVDPSVTKDLFLQWRSPRFGTSNPERMNNPVWEWLVKTRIKAYQATQRLYGPSAMVAGPGWCFDRFGQSETKLPDGRIVFVAGEHEDYYDPDFNIYNDVVVQHPDGRLDIYGYPREIFPPTDFHSATLVGNRIVLIGSLGYPDDRRPGSTPVLVLDLESLSISGMKTSGTPPGWIHEHTATLSDDGHSILIQRGQLVLTDKDRTFVENINDWRLHLDNWRWERLTDRRWPRWEVRRKDGERNHLTDYQMEAWSKEFPVLEKAQQELEKTNGKLETPTLKEQLGKRPDFELFKRRYRPPVAHEPQAQAEGEHNIHRILVHGVVVRYVEDMSGVQMTVEGELPQKTLDSLTSDLLDKLSSLENTPCELIRL